MRAMGSFKRLTLLALLAGCGGAPSASTDAGRTAADADVAVADGGRADGGDGGDDGAAGDRPAAFDAGPSPGCDLAAFTRHVLDASPGVDTLEPAALVRVAGGFLLVARQASARLGLPDAAAARRDTIDVAALTAGGALAAGWSTLYESAAAQSDLSLPAAAAAGDGAVVLFRESGQGAGGEGFTTRLRGVAVGPRGARRGAEVVLPDRGDPFAAALPDGTVLVLAPRVVATSDAGFAVATPNAIRVRGDGTVVSAAGVDLTNVIPITAESVLLRGRPDGATAVFRAFADVHAVAFDRAGVVDTRVPIGRGVDAPRLDDAAALAGAAVVGWDAPVGDAHAIHAAVIDGDGRVLANEVLERFDAATQPTVAVVPTHGGAAVLWIRGGGDAAVLRGAVVQPDGAVRRAARDLLPVPGADGRLLAAGEGRAVFFAARDRSGGTRGVTAGGLCLPE